MRLNRPHDPRRRTSNSGPPNDHAPGYAADVDDAAEWGTTSSSLQGRRRATPSAAHAAPAHRRRVALAARTAVVLAATVLMVIVSAPAATAHADQVLAQQVLAQEVLAQAESVDAVLDNIRNWLIGILAALATVFLTIGGVRYVYGSGDPGEVEKAKQAFKAAALGYGIAALAPLIVTVLQSIVGL